MKQGEIWYANLNPTKGNEQAGHRPIVIISGDLMNAHLGIVICCPLTSKVKNYKGNTIITPNASNKLEHASEILTFHIHSISKDRLTKKIGVISKSELNATIKSLNEILCY